jgi:hypothetical protein
MKTPSGEALISRTRYFEEDTYRKVVCTLWQRTCSSAVSWPFHVFPCGHPATHVRARLPSATDWRQEPSIPVLDAYGFGLLMWLARPSRRGCNNVWAGLQRRNDDLNSGSRTCRALIVRTGRLV